jgi:rhodanese-related sulfurtransferase
MEMQSCLGSEHPHGRRRELDAIGSTEDWGPHLLPDFLAHDSALSRAAMHRDKMTRMNLHLLKRTFAMSAAVALVVALAPGQAAGQWAQASSTSAFSIPTSAQMQPEELNRMLAAKEKPLILQVGSRVLFAQAHIAGSEYAGPGSQPEGLSRLKARVQGLAKNTPIVIYCGCCPWERCPNMGPAYKQLIDLGFTRVKALFMATNLGTDWVQKGYPVASGE